TFSAGNWSATASGTGPSPHGRTLANLVDDLADGYPVLYGGTDAVLEAVLGDTWSYHSGNWSLLLVPTAPPARAVPSLVDDPSDGSLLMFGGSGLNESWAYRAGNWTLQGAGATPPGRLEAGMAYDANDSEVVLFGGIGGGTGFPLLNDTWAYSAGRWTNLTSTAGGPPPLAGAMMAYDPMAKEVLLFGGESRLGYTSQTWEFSRGHWTNLTGGLTTSPPGRGFGMMTFDGADNYLLLVGGIGPPSPLTGFCDYLCGDSWEFTNGAWTQLHPTIGPPPSDGAGIAYDPILRQVVLFGGTGEHRSASSGSVAYLNETWTYAGGLWSNLTSSLSVSPPPQDTGTGVNLVFDSHDGYTFAFEGGFPGSSWWKFGNQATSPLSVSIPYGTPDPLSLGQPITIGASVGGGVSPYSYTWTGLPAGCNSANRSSFSCTPSADGNFTIRVTVTDAAGMVQPSPALQLFIDAAFVRVAISPDPALLPPNGTLVLTATPKHADGSAVPGAVAYNWSVYPSNLGALTTREGSSTTFAAGKSAGTVTVYVNATFGGATQGASQKVAIAIAPLVVTSFTVVPSTLGLNGGPVTFTVVPAGGTPPYSYRYVGLPPGCSSANQSVLNCTVHSAGNWNVTLLLSDSGRHQTSANVLLQVVGMGAGGGPSVWSIPIVQWAGLLVIVIVVAIVAVAAVMRRRRVPPPLSARPPPG
ncbi:MAG: hypothetical protein L3J96_02725, partial [Thermoplasmata archaeon]|nr:hypothetical protein [Thermoplasmata archaeon]